MAAGYAKSDWQFDLLTREVTMRSILLYMVGVPIPIIILIALFWH
jgi:hypothetical protein